MRLAYLLILPALLSQMLPARADLPLSDDDFRRHRPPVVDEQKRPPIIPPAWQDPAPATGTGAGKQPLNTIMVDPVFHGGSQPVRLDGMNNTFPQQSPILGPELERVQKTGVDQKPGDTLRKKTQGLQGVHMTASKTAANKTTAVNKAVENRAAAANKAASANKTAAEGKTVAAGKTAAAAKSAKTSTAQN